MERKTAKDSGLEFVSCDMGTTKWGAHLSKEGSFLGTLSQAEQFGCTAIQVFAHSPYKYFAEKSLDLLAAKAWGEEAKAKGIVTVFHAAFMVNLASPKANIYAVSKKSVVEDMRLAQACGVPFVVVHSGSYTKESNLEQGVLRIAEALVSIIHAANAPDVTLLIETHSGGGTAVGGVIANLVFIMELVAAQNPDVAKQIGICLDTAHTYAAGYDFEQESVLEATSSALKPWLRVVHFNNPDPNVELGKHLDRHRSKFEAGKMSDRKSVV